MEREKILSEISGRLGETSFSQQTLGMYVDLNPVPEGGEPDDAYFTKAVGFLKGMQGQYNHDVATRVEDFKKNYKPASGTVKPVPPAEDKEMEELKNTVKALQEKMAEAESREAQKGLAAKVKAEMKAQNATDGYVLEKVLQVATLDPAKSAKELATELLPKYDAEYKACRGDGTAPRKAKPAAGKEANEADSYFARKAKKEGWGK